MLACGELLSHKIRLASKLRKKESIKKGHLLFWFMIVKKYEFHLFKSTNSLRRI